MVFFQEQRNKLGLTSGMGVHKASRVMLTFPNGILRFKTPLGLRFHRPSPRSKGILASTAALQNLTQYCALVCRTKLCRKHE